MNIKHKYLYLIFLIIISTFNLEARPCSYNLDSIFKYSDFCDRVEVIYYQPFQLSVKSKLDGLTYTFYKNLINHQNFPNSKFEHIIIRGRISSEFNATSCVVLGELVNNEILFYIWDGDLCSYISTNPIAKIINSKDIRECIKYPKSFFTFKTPSLDWNEEEKEANRLLFLSGKLEEIKFEKFHTQFINDSIHIIIDTINYSHMKIIMHFKTRKSYEYFNGEVNMKSILNSIGLPYNKIVDGSNKTTSEFDFKYPITSYSNMSYKLITYKLIELEEEAIVIMDLHKNK